MHITKFRVFSVVILFQALSCCSSVSFLSSVLSSVTYSCAQLGWDPATDLGTEEYSISFLQKVLSYFHSMFMVIVHLLSIDQFSNIWQMWTDYSPIHLRIAAYTYTISFIYLIWKESIHYPWIVKFVNHNMHVFKIV